MDDFVGTARVLIAVGFALMLVMLRLDAERFGTAEYYEVTRDGERPSVMTRVAWYLLGVGLAVGIMLIHPSPQIDFFLGTGDRAQSVAWGLAYGLIGTAQALIYAFLRYHRIRFPEVRSYPGALLNATVTAFIDEVAFRGALFGLLLLTGLDPTLANIIQAILLHAHDPPRRAWPGPLPVRADHRHRARRWLPDGLDRWDRRGLPRACHHPVRGLPVHRPHRPAAAAGPGGRGDRGATPAAAGLADRRLAGSGAAGSVTAAAAMPPTASAALPPVALYVHIPFCVSLCPVLRLRRLRRGGGPGAAQPRRRVPRGARDRAGASRGRAFPIRRSRGAAAARNRLLRRRHTVAAPSRGHCAAARADPGTVRADRRGRGDARGQPRARRTR